MAGSNPIPLYRSIHGRIFGFDANNDLVLNGVRITNVGGGAAAAIGTPGTGVTGLTGAAQSFNTLLTLTAKLVTVTDDAGQGQYGGCGLIFTFPAGLVKVDGAVVTGTLTMGATGTFIDTFASVVALGSVTATTGNTLVAGEATWLQSVANAQAVAKVSAVDAVSIATQLTESGGRWFDGTATPAPVYLNFLITDDGTHTSGTGAFTGTVQLMWSIIGDN